MVNGVTPVSRTASPEFLGHGDDNEESQSNNGRSCVSGRQGTANRASSQANTTGDRRPLIIHAAEPAVSETEYDDESAADMEDVAAAFISATETREGNDPTGLSS